MNQIPGACRGSCGTGVDFTDVFVTKIDAAGSALVYSSYIGGSRGDEGLAIAVDGFGNAYLTGITESSDFPIVNQIPGACQGSCGADDIFVTKINAAGSALAYSSYLGGSAADEGEAIAVDRFGNAYVTGFTDSFDFPIAGPVGQIPGACKGSCGTGSSSDVFVTRILDVGPTPVLPFFSDFGCGNIY